jgi:hypothetical protein
VQVRFIRSESEQAEGNFKVRCFLQERGTRNPRKSTRQHPLQLLLFSQSFNDHFATIEQISPARELLLLDLQLIIFSDTVTAVLKVLINASTRSEPLRWNFNHYTPCHIRSRLRL